MDGRVRNYTILRQLLNVEPTDVEVRMNYYESWRKSTKEPFVMIYKDFKERHLKELDGGPLKLYLFFLFGAKNATGESNYSVSKIADFFGTSTRTIDGWMKPLLSRNLISRGKGGSKSRSSVTFLVPYGTSLISLRKPQKQNFDDNQALADHFLSRIEKNEHIYGDLIGVFHLFQWGLEKRKVSKNKSTQLILFVTKRSDGIVTGQYHRLLNSIDQGIGNMMIDDPVRFVSPLQFRGKPILGIAVNHTEKLTTLDNKRLKGLTDQFAEFTSDDDADHLEEVMYGLTDEVLEEDDNAEMIEEGTGEEDTSSAEHQEELEK